MMTCVYVFFFGGVYIVSGVCTSLVAGLQPKVNNTWEEFSAKNGQKGKVQRRVAALADMRAEQHHLALVPEPP